MSNPTVTAYRVFCLAWDCPHCGNRNRMAEPPWLGSIVALRCSSCGKEATLHSVVYDNGAIVTLDNGKATA